MMNLINQLQSMLFEGVVEPLTYSLGMMAYVETAFDGCEWVVLGVFELALLTLFALTFERWFSVEQSSYQPLGHGPSRRSAISTDIIYTLIHRLGLFPLLVFFTAVPLIDELEGHMRLLGINRPNLENWFPVLIEQPVLSFLVYLLLLDFVDYWIHRAQHASNRWWALHSLHHSQQHMTVWSDNRNHLLDDWLRDALLALAALAIGVPPGQYIWLLLVPRLVQSLQHANVKWSFGRIGDRVLVSPFFHRLHHAVGVGHEGVHKGCNFAVLFPVWDWMFGTADWQVRYEPTGVSDQNDGKQYGTGFWSQQWLGLKRLLE